MKKSLLKIAKTLCVILTALGLLAGGYAIYLWHAENSLRRIATDKDIATGLVRVHGMEQLELQTPVKAKPIALSHTLRLAIGGLGLTDENENRQLGDLVTVDLTDAPGFALVERQALSVVLQELNLNWAGFVRAKDAVRVGKLLKADWFLLATESKINGTNSLVARVVDARTGVMMDAGVVPAAKPLTQVAADLATFLRASRQNAAQPTPHVFLAIGAFEDLSVNSRQADFPKQLQGYLTAAYRGSGVTLLEREYVETLLQEVHLDLAGLTDDSSQNSSVAMQSAFWLVDGRYQSYETTNLQIELNLDIQRAFGKSFERKLRALPGEVIGLQTKAAIDDVMQHNPTPVYPTRRTEARMQIEIGRELSGLNGGLAFELVISSGNWQDISQKDPQAIAHRKRKILEAVRAFQTALLLESTNREAKAYLAMCFRHTDVMRLEESCNLYRELIDEPVQDKWSGLAQQALLETFNWYGVDERLRWLKSAASQTTNQVASTFYLQQIQAAETLATIDAGNSPKAEALAEDRLFEAIRSANDSNHHKLGSVYHYGFGMGDYLAVFGADQVRGAAKLAGLLPKMTQQFPELEAELVTCVLSCQPSADTPVMADFQRVLTNLVQNPNPNMNSGQLWVYISQLYYWSVDRTNYPLAIQVLESVRAAAKKNNMVTFGEMDNIRLAYAYLSEARWQDALHIFESFNHRPVKTDSRGPWGDVFSVIWPDQKADDCRRKLGLPVTQDARRFDLGMSVLCLCSPSSFVVADDGLWVGIDGQLLHLDFELHTNLAVKLPMDASIPITALRPTSSSIWIATRGAGLIEFNQASRQCRLITEADGLLMNEVGAVEPSGDALWIGYNGATGGGLGKMDLGSGKIVSFMPSLHASATPRESQTTPHGAISKIVAAADHSLLIPVAGSLKQFHIERGEWETLTNPIGNSVSAICADSQYFVEGGGLGGKNGTEVDVEDQPDPKAPTNELKQTQLFLPESVNLAQLTHNLETNGSHQHITRVTPASIPPKIVLAIENLPEQRWQSLEDAQAIPNPPSTLTLDGDNLWVGGGGAIALVDLRENKVKKFCHIKAAQVDCIQIGGGYLWAQFDWHLFRAPLSALE